MGELSIAKKAAEEKSEKASNRRIAAAALLEREKRRRREVEEEEKLRIELMEGSQEGRDKQEYDMFCHAFSVFSKWKMLRDVMKEEKEKNNKTETENRNENANPNVKDNSRKAFGERNTTSAGKEVVLERLGSASLSKSVRTIIHSPPLQPISSSSSPSFSPSLPHILPPFFPFPPSPSSSSSSSSSSLFPHSKNSQSTQSTSEDPVPLFHKLSDLILSRYPSSIKAAVSLYNLYSVMNQVI